MDRSGGKPFKHGPAMPADGSFAIRVVLHPGGRERGKPRADAPAGRAVHAHALLWGASHDVLAGAARPWGEREAGAAADAADGTGSDLSETAAVGARTRTPDLSLSPAGVEDRSTQPGVGQRYHLYWAAPRVYLSGGDPGRVQPLRGGLGSVGIVGERLLPGGASLEGALKTARPEIFNADQGSQFTSEVFTQRLEENGITISMDGRGRAMDNIFVERLWRRVKYEEVYRKDDEQVAEAVTNLGRYFRFYNYERAPPALSYQTPAALSLGEWKAAARGDEKQGNTGGRRKRLWRSVKYGKVCRKDYEQVREAVPNLVRNLVY